MKRLALAALAVAGVSSGPAGAVEYLTMAVQPDRATPAACFSFSAPLPRGKADSFDPFVAVQPPVDRNLQPRGKDLCLTGLKHGNRYTVRLKAGLPASDGTMLPKDVTVEVAVPDREARVSFSGDKTILPYRPGVGLPLRSVNASTAKITVYRIGERGLADGSGAEWYGQALSGYGLSQVAERASKVFDGSVDIANKANADVVTALPIDGLVKALSPGMYVAIATPGASQPDDDVERATQWFSVSDIGLIAVRTDSGTLVAARSLATALALPDVELKLVARSNEVLASWKTGPEGRVTVPAGLLRGEGGDTARLLVATLPRGDFTLLRLDAPPLDLSDLGVEGRTPPGALDAFLWTDRGIYRPGETVHLGTLLRDNHGALAPSVPLTLHLERPDGIEVDRFPAVLDQAAGGARDIPVPENAYSGTWTVWAGVGGKERLGSVSFSVQDFVPPRLDVGLDLAGPTPAVGQVVQAQVAADYFYGSPGAGLSGSLDATVQAAGEPFPDFKGFRFGLVQEPVLPRQLDAQSFTTDDKGRATVAFTPDGLPDTTVPLELVLKATVNDVDGRAADTELTKPLRTADRFVGLRTSFGAGTAENSEAGFDLVWLDREGKPAGATTLSWELVSEDYTYNSFFKDGRWQSEEVVIDSRVNGGSVAIGADGRGRLSAPVGSGRYRLEAYSADGKAATSLRFGAGWWGEASAENRKPDVLPVTVDAAAPPGTVRARIEPAFAGRVLAMLDGDGLHQVQELDLPKGGDTVTFDGRDVPASGAYVLAVAIAPSGAVLPRLPVRALGAAWVAGTAAEHRLDVALAAPDKIAPKTTLNVGVTVKGAPRDRPAYVTVAAVDEAVLGMTDFATPDPAEHFVGRREPGIEWRDVYSSLIDPDGQPGRLTEGGDAQAVKQIGGLDVKTFKTVALFSGPVALDPDGRGSVSFPVPEFSGKLRLMAVAWTVDRFGSAEGSVLVRPPLLVELTLPRFLAPGDKAATRVMLTDLEAAEQSYQVTLSTQGPISFERTDVAFKDVKRDKRRYADRTLTATGGIGKATIHMSVAGDDGTVAERDYEIGVRPPSAFVTSRQLRTLDPAARLTAGDALGQDMLPGTATLDVDVATVPAFDVPGLLAALRRYPYGCAEQTVSRAFPELFAATLGGAPAVAGTPTGQDAMARLFSLQAADGSFGYWTSFDTGNLWLTAYVVDFLQHAEKAGLIVPASMTGRALGWLGGRFAAAGTAPADVAGNAYAAVVLARANQLDRSQLRYVSTRDGAALPSDLARVQLAAALTRSGERDLAARLLRQPPVKRDAKVWLNDYGSPLRDRAMALSLAAEEKLVPEKALVDRAAELSREASGSPFLSTQEQVWLLRAAFDLSAKAPLTVQLDGKAISGRSRAAASIPLGKGRSIEVANGGTDPVYLSLATTGVPSGVPAPESNGFSVSRSLFTLKGEPVKLGDIHQNDGIVAVVEGRMDAEIQRKVLVVDLLPAGLEPDTVGLGGSEDAGTFEWLKDLTTPTFQAIRDDRYVAGFDLTSDARTFKIAYTVRAVTPGSYARPGPQVEDMYAPAYHARGEAGTLEVKPARKP